MLNSNGSMPGTTIFWTCCILGLMMLAMATYRHVSARWSYPSVSKSSGLVSLTISVGMVLMKCLQFENTRIMGMPLVSNASLFWHCAHPFMRSLFPLSKRTPHRLAVSAMLMPVLSCIQMAGSAMPCIVLPRSHGCSRSTRAIYWNCFSAVHLTPSFGSPVQPYIYKIKYSTPSVLSAHHVTAKGLLYP